MRTQSMALALFVVALAGCPAKEPKPTFDKKDLLREDVPASSDKEYVAHYQRQTATVEMWTSDEPEDREEDQKKAVQTLVEELKKKAFREAAQQINHDLAQPMDHVEFARAVDQASKNYLNYFNDWKPYEQKWNDDADQCEVSVWFAIDKPKLRKALVSSRAITTVAKYKTYVELFWNVPGKKINPDVIDSILSTTEDRLAQGGYEVVQFDKIKGKLIKRLEELGEPTDDLSADDEQARFEANLELRNIDKKFENGKQILAEYADVLVGVTVSALEVTPDKMLRVRIKADATLFERGEWVSLASSEKSKALPYVAGSVDSMIQVSRLATKGMCDDLEPKVRKKLSTRKAVEEVVEGEPQDYTLVFKGYSGSDFNTIRRTLKRYTRWDYQRADTAAKEVFVTFEGTKDDVADKAQTLLEGAGLPVGDASFSTDGRKILFAAPE